MKKRKLIGILTSIPETVYGERTIEGVMCQCKKYDYDIAVFSSLVHVSSDPSKYKDGELNIYELPCYDMLDGVIIDTIPMTENNDYYLTDRICKRLEKECKCPVMALNLPVGNYPVVKNDDSVIFREITEHIINVHKCRDIYFLTGFKGDIIAESRLDVFKNVMAERGLDVPAENVFYGNFWYSAGYDLADKILSGEVHKPEAVICASDHMALGLVNRLTEHGIRVPDEIVITGFEAVQEALLNDISITTFESNASKTAADAVDMIRRQIDPDGEIIPYDPSIKHIHSGMSCGCVPDAFHSYKSFKNFFYYLNHDFGGPDPFANIDIGLLMEGYVSEALMGTETPAECLKEVFMKTYLMRPYTEFYLCLKEDWLDIDNDIYDGYPEKMKLVVHTAVKENTGFYEEEKSVVFDTRLMLPRIYEDRDEPMVFYFNSVHFQNKMLGYAVLVKTHHESKISIVYRNWLRFVSSSLEMSRAKNRLLKLSVHDEMTGAYNRRGMQMKLDEMLSAAKKGDIFFAAVVDMDGLKYINDNFGHEEGDIGIKLVCQAANAMTVQGEINVRAGGDEFYIIGVGDYNEEKLKRKEEVFNKYIEAKGRPADKPFTYSASIGFAMMEYNDDFSVEDLISTADVNMYRSKIERRMQRI